MIRAGVLLLTVLYPIFGYSAPVIEYTDIRQCVIDAAVEYEVAPALIFKIIRAESSGNIYAMNVKGKSFNSLTRSQAIAKLTHEIDVDSSTDVGLMQINIHHYLSDHPETRRSDLLGLLDPCFNIRVGTYIIASRFKRMGFGWTAVGSYNVGQSGILGKRGSRLRKIGLEYIQRINKNSGSPVTAWGYSESRQYLMAEK